MFVFEDVVFDSVVLEFEDDVFDSVVDDVVF